MHKFVWILDEGKCLINEEVRKLRKVVEERKAEALSSDRKTAVRDWFVINLCLFTGLRVIEVSRLKNEDVIINNGG